MSNPISKGIERKKKKQESEYLQEIKEKYSRPKIKDEVYCKKKEICPFRRFISGQLIFHDSLSEWHKFCFLRDFLFHKIPQRFDINIDFCQKSCKLFKEDYRTDIKSYQCRFLGLCRLAVKLQSYDSAIYHAWLVITKTKNINCVFPKGTNDALIWNLLDALEIRNVDDFCKICKDKKLEQELPALKELFSKGEKSNG